MLALPDWLIRSGNLGSRKKLCPRPRLLRVGLHVKIALQVFWSEI